MASLRGLLCLMALLGVHAADLRSAQAGAWANRWSQTETSHFIIVHDSEHQALADQYAEYSERAWSKNADLFGIWPTKTVVWLNDATDISNGYATGVPYPLIGAFPALPPVLESIADLHNWGEQLMVHEYAHILNLEPARGVFLPLRYLLGSIVRPNMLLPRWYLEGLAVEIETRQSQSSGRLRSANFTAITRAMSLEGTLELEDIARVNEVSIPDWPGGVRPYLLGAHLWNEIIRTKGHEVIREFNDRYAARVPYWIDPPARETLGLPYGELLASVYRRLRSDIAQQLEAMQAGPSRPLAPPPSPDLPLAGAQRLPGQQGFESHSPAISPNGLRLAFVERQHNVESRIVVQERSSDNQSWSGVNDRKLTFDGAQTNRVSWLPDGESLVFDRLDTVDRDFERMDLWLYNLSEKKRHRITRGMRSREAAVFSPGPGRTPWLFFVRLVPGGTRLSAIELRDDPSSKGYRPLTPKDAVDLGEWPLQTRLSRPWVTAPDMAGTSALLYSERPEGGRDRLMVRRFRLPAGATAPQWTDPAATAVAGLEEFPSAHSPVVSGESLLFVSDLNGLSNVYTASLQWSVDGSPVLVRDVRATTNVATAAQTPLFDSSSGELLFSFLRASGYQIVSLNPQQLAEVSPRLPRVAPLIDESSLKPAPERAREPLVLARSTYRPWPFLLPRYWFPQVGVLADGYFVSASTGSADPVGRHAYQVSGQWDSITRQPGGAFVLVNRTLPLDLQLSVADFPETISAGSSVSRRSSLADLAAIGPIWGLSDSWRWTASATRLESSIPGRQVVRAGPSLGLSYQDLSQRGHEISPEKGSSFAIRHTQYIRFNEESSAYGLTTLGASGYLSARSAKWLEWVPERHVLALSINAAYAPQLEPLVLGATTVSSSLGARSASTVVPMRGYPSGAFIGRQLFQGSVEYRFPLQRVESGFGTLPFFLRRWHGTLFWDGIGVDGAVYDAASKQYRTAPLGRVYSSLGALAKLDLTAFYHAPLQLQVGVVMGLDQSVNSLGAYPFVGLSL